MKKYTRQRIILDLIENNEIRTQEDLSEYLITRGVKATQATISRDIKELKISKVQTRNGEYKYSVVDTINDSLSERLSKICKLATLSVKHNDDMILIKTISHTASICGTYIENSKIKGVSGIVTGNDTIFIAVEDKQELDRILEEIKKLIR
ncbi:MAG: arginine repressor [Peptoniphilaceae bacterium]|uniref:arginine repressor n=1 Tax=Parvimonas sp. TaxID=1944660 RepID=UPI0025FFD2CC|nr:arginine repressor [Parvimonas sp.]MCI5997576.1 arginine repressor [Parvimonas sp.]MDD7765171.1 arginine repressor [Peptoniphilaceae bacterium]MDY3051212.1 arginine repressor [Parvimonas sp.]